MIRVGGRLQNSYISDDCKHPILLPRKGKVSELIIKHWHSKVAHGGSGFTLNEIQGAGYWIVSVNSAVKKVISNHIEYRRFRGRVGEQKMANFNHCRVEMFGPFTVKQRRSTVKQYVAMFTCMTSRAVHTEVTFSLDTDSFILALRRLVARQGNIRSICSDNGSNFMNSKKHIWQWMTRKFNLSCWNKVVTGLDGTRTLLLQVIWVEFESDRFAQQELF